MTARRQQDRAAEEQPTGQSRLNQGLAAAVTALGVLVLAGAWLLREGPDQYWLSLLVNFGTTLLLFAVLVLVERRLYQRIEAVLPHNKVDALSPRHSQVHRQRGAVFSFRERSLFLRHQHDLLPEIRHFLLAIGLVEINDVL